MVLDWLVNVHKIEEHPERMLLFGFIYSSIAAGVALLIFPREAGAVMMVLTIAAFLPIMLNLMKEEEIKDEKEKFLVREHWPALKFFIFLFLGMLLAFTVWYLLLPQATANNLFKMQIETITGRGVEMGAISGGSSLLSILANNMKVLVVGLFLAFVFGAGAIFILEWNATLLATLIGGTIRHSFDLGALRYLVHGIPEVIAYFIAGLAGGVISIAVARHKLGDKEFTHVIKDSLALILVSVALLVVAALTEVYVSPLIG